MVPFVHRKRNRRARWSATRVAGLASLLLVLSPSALAQSGSIELEVVDDQGRPLAGATVVLSNRDGLSPQIAEQTSADGRVRFPILRPGFGYALRVSMPGFAEQRLTELRVSTNGNDALRLQLTPHI